MPTEALNRWILDSTTDMAIIATDRTGHVTAWNEGARLIFGWSEKEMVGNTVDRIFTADDRAADRLNVEMQQALDAGSARDERWHLRQNGERFWATAETTVLENRAGALVGFVKVVRDRTEQRLASDSLQSSQNTVRLLLDSMVEGFYAIDRNGVATVCNAAFIKMMGFAREEDAVGRSLHEVLHSKHPDGSHYDVADCPIYRCARDGTPAHVTNEFFFPVDGSPPLRVQYWAHPIRNEGVLQGAICTFLAIGDEHNASERLQLALAAGAIVGTWVWDVPDNKFIADERFANSFGLSSEACRTGLSLEQVVSSIHAEDRERVDNAINAVLENGGPYRCEYRVLQRDGVYRWIEANGQVELDSEGKPLRFPGVLLDVGARRTAEAERDRVAELLKVFTAAVPGVVYAKDREGRLLIGNNGTTQLIGKPPEFYVGKTDMEILEDKQQAAHVMATDRRIMESGRAEQIEEEVRLADGTPAIWLSTKEPLRNADGEVIGLVGSSVDVTARRKAEAEVRELNRTLEQRIAEAIAEREVVQEALRQSQKMEAVGQLTGGLAHDFNNLLTGMMGNLELLQARIARGRLEDLERFILAAQGAARRAGSLTQRLLAFSRRQTLDPRPTDINRLISGLEELLRRTVGPSITIEIVGAAGLWVANIDGGQLENAFLNLCLNARDAMPNGGRITIETANRWLDQRGAKERDIPPGQYLALCVTDTGTGMSAETIERAFEPFYTTKPIGQGTGLGLSMIYGFARQSGGQVRIYSEVGVGTTVCIYLPRHIGDAEDVEPEDVSMPVEGARGQTVLIIDDEATIRDLIDEVLGDLEYTVLPAIDGAAGLKILQSGTKVDLLITDVGLPNGLNGRQVADAARAIRPELKVLFITGYAENAAVGNGHLEPGMALLTKPFTLEAMAAKVFDMLETTT